MTLALLLPDGVAGVEAHRLEEQGGQPDHLAGVGRRGWSWPHDTGGPDGFGVMARREFVFSH